MLAEPDIDYTALQDFIQQQFGLTIERLHFHPTYWLSVCYVAECANGERRFIRLLSQKTGTSFAASEADFYLPLLPELFRLGILRQLPLPCRTWNGDLHITFGEYDLIVYTYIDGKVVGFGTLSIDILGKLGRLVGRLHARSGEVVLPQKHVEHFNIVFEAEIAQALDDVDHMQPDEHSAREQLRAMVMPHREGLLGYLHRLHDLQEVARRSNPRLVICHTDLHGGNLMLGPQGELYILDWENAMLAPAEHDLFLFAGEVNFWDVFLPAYEREAGKARLDRDLLGFYYYRRLFEDLVDFILRVQSGLGDEQRDQDDLVGVRECLEDLPQVEATLEAIRQHKG